MSRRASRKGEKGLNAFLALIIALVGVGIVGVAPAPAAGTARSISLVTGETSSQVSDMSFLATRSQKKLLERSGATAPYTISHTNPDPSLSYSYQTDVKYGDYTARHSSCTASPSTVSNNRSCDAQLRESDYRVATSLGFTGTSVTTSAATLANSGQIPNTPIGGTSSNMSAGGVNTFGSAFGPQVWSEPFEASSGQAVSFEWKASGGGDDYEVYGFLVKVNSTLANCSASTDRGGTTEAEKLASHSILVYSRGKTASTYSTASGLVSEEACYRFRFVNGTYDASGGFAVGATFFIQNVKIGNAQTLTFASVSDVVKGSTNQTVNLTATSNAPSAVVTYASTTSGICSVNSSTGVVTVFTTAGICTIKADSPSIGEYGPAPTTYKSFNVLNAATAPISSGGNTVSGNPLVCSTLSVSEGVWADGGATISASIVQWQRDGVDISSATGTSYTVTPDDIGKVISFNISKVNSVGSTSASSNGLTVLDARLNALTVSHGSLSPSFGGCTTSYAVTSASRSFSLTPTANAAAATLTVGGSSSLSGQPSNPITLQAGANSIPLVITNGAYSRTVTVTVTYADAPTVSAEMPSNLTGTSATLKATINPNGNTTTSISFELFTAFDANNPSNNVSASGVTFGSISASSVSGMDNVSLTQNVTGLISGGTYFMRVTSSNSVGQSSSNIIAFQTPDAPLATTDSASSVTSSGAVLNGIVNGFGRSTSAKFVVSTAADLSSSIDYLLSSITQSDPTVTTTVSETLSGLNVGTIYYFRIEATNAIGTNVGDIKSFLTSAAPTVTNESISPDSRSATLKARVNANGSNTTSAVVFRYGTSSTLSTYTTVTATPSSVVGVTSTLVAKDITGLTPATTYYFQAVARNSINETASTITSFTTIADPAPSVTLSGPSSVQTGDSITVVIRFSEAVTGFASNDLTIAGVSGYAAQTQRDLGGGVYSVELLRTSGTATGNMTIDVASGAVTDAANQNNTAATRLTIAITGAVPNISYTSGNLSLPAGSAISSLNPSNTGAAASSWSVSPSLPSGLALNTSTGVISGTPTTATSSATYIVTATSAGGNDTFTFTIVVTAPVPNINYSSNALTLTVGATMTTLSPTNTGGAVSSWSVSPSLPTGLLLNGSGELSGTPTTAGTSQNFVITASNSGGSDTYTIAIAIAEAQIIVLSPAPDILMPAPSPAPSPVPSASPRPLPTQAASPSPRPVPSPSNAVTPEVPKPSVITSAFQPVVTPRQNVIYESVREIPPILVEALSRPVAIESNSDSSPKLPELAPRDGVAVVNGEAVTVRIFETASNDGYVAQGDGFQITFAAVDEKGKVVKLDNKGNLVLDGDRRVKFSGYGFAPGSIIKVWLFSDPVSLKQVFADENGKFVGQAVVPGKIPFGEHTVQLNGLTKEGVVRTLSMGVVLAEPEPVAAVTEVQAQAEAPSLNWTWLAILLLILFILWLILSKKRRRKKSH